MRSRTMWMVVATALFTLLPALPALACSCAIGDPREALHDADAAFIGTFVESREAEPLEPGEPISSGRDLIYTFTVDEGLKGEFGATVEVYAAADGASCGLEVWPGDQTGLLLDDDEGTWRSNLCQMYPPDDLRAAAQPLPEPDGAGHARFLIGGGYGEARLVAADGAGRTLAYGYGRGDTRDIDVCPGSSYSVEIVAIEDRRRARLAVRDLETFDVVRKQTLPFDSWWGDGGLQTAGLECESPDAGNVVVFGTDYSEPLPRGRLVRVTPDGIERLFAGRAGRAAFTNGFAFLATGKWWRNIQRLDLATGERSDFARAHRMPPLYPSPDGTEVASYRTRWTGNDHARIYVYGEDGSVRSTRLAAHENYPEGEIVWLGARLAFLPYGGDTDKAKIYSAGLEVAETFEWYARQVHVVGNTFYGIDYHDLVGAPIGEDMQVLHELLGPETAALAVIP